MTIDRPGLAALCHMSTDYYARLERETGPHPSEQMIASMAQGLHLSLAERDHLFRLAGHRPPATGEASDHVSPAMLRILDRLHDTPAEVVNELGETLRQSPLGAALLGDATRHTGSARSIIVRWFLDPKTRRRYVPEDHELLSRTFTSSLRQAVALRGPGSRAAQYVDLLLDGSEEFAELWARQEVGVRPAQRKRFRHPEVGVLELDCQMLLDPDQAHGLLVYTATPGSESAEKLQLLSVIGEGIGV